MNSTTPSALRDAGLAAMLDFSFSRFITLSIIKILYILGLVAIAFVWLAATVAAFGMGAIAGIGMAITGAIIAVVYAIFFRVSLELIVMIFRIGENTSKLVELRGGTPAPTGS